jgi:hypothetical protein
MMPQAYIVGSITIRGVKLIQYSNGKIWLVNHNDIGIEVDSSKLEDYLNEFYEEHK